MLDPLDHLADDVGTRRDVDPELAGLQLDRGTSRHLGDEDALHVADHGGFEVVVHLRRDLDGRRVQPGLVREGSGTDVGRMRVLREVRDLGDRVRDTLHLGEAAVG